MYETTTNYYMLFIFLVEKFKISIEIINNFYDIISTKKLNFQRFILSSFTKTFSEEKLLYLESLKYFLSNTKLLLFLYKKFVNEGSGVKWAGLKLGQASFFNFNYILKPMFV